MIAYKLFRQRKDGTLGSLFINPKARLKPGEWLKSDIYPTQGFAIRAGWHTLARKYAPHLSKKNRVWRQVEIKDFTEIKRPKNHGGKWFIAKQMMILDKNVSIS
jgi:hypothetical protein